MTTQQYLLQIEAEIAAQRFGSSPKSLYEPLRYIMKIGGKRIRPMFVALAHRLYKKHTKVAVKIAVAIEALHNFTLLHDDIMDDAPLRRGQRTVHEQWDVNTAILSGDVMLVKVYDMLLHLPPDQLKEGIMRFNRCVTTVCEGQQRDMLFTQRKHITRTAYLEMIRQKTAALLGFSLELGAFVARASTEDQRRLKSVGIDIGIGFQLADDLLDVYARKKRFGKKKGGDIVANKRTFLLVTALERARGRDRQQLLWWLRQKRFDSKQKIESVIALYDRLGVAEYTRKRTRFFFHRGLARLDDVQAPASRKKVLSEFIHGLIDRSV